MYATSVRVEVLFHSEGMHPSEVLYPPCYGKRRTEASPHARHPRSIRPPYNVSIMLSICINITSYHIQVYTDMVDEWTRVRRCSRYRTIIMHMCVLQIKIQYRMEGNAVSSSYSV